MQFNIDDLLSHFLPTFCNCANNWLFYLDSRSGIVHDINVETWDSYLWVLVRNMLGGGMESAYFYPDGSNC